MKNALSNYVGKGKATPVDERTPGRNDEVKNNTGGFTFAVSPKDRLERFLILGTDGGTYYVGESKLTADNAEFVIGLIRSNERLVVDTLLDVVTNNRAAKNQPAIFVLALLFVHGNDKAYLRDVDAVNKVLRTSTHLFEFANFIDGLGGWGRAKRDAIAGWYTGKDPEALAYQAVKYRQREGWTHRDLFRKVHPVGVDASVGNFILGKETDASGVIEGFQRMQRAGSVKEVIAILKEYKNLPWETIPTQFLNEGEVWRTLFYNGALGQTALLRNVTRFAKLGLFDDVVTAGDIALALADEDKILKGRIHPVAYANALGVYRNGTPQRGYGWGSMSYAPSYGYGGSNREWNVNAKVAGALEAGFYNAFGAITPANKATMISLDISGSMSWEAPAGLVGMSCREASAVMAMVALRTEPYAVINGFSHQLRELPISDKDSLDTVVKKISDLPFGSTNVSLPMTHAKAKGLGIDSFFVYTDNELNTGNIKPTQALKAYREASGRDARLAVVGMAATNFTVADPRDRGQMDFVGMDASAPAVMADFSAGRI